MRSVRRLIQTAFLISFAIIVPGRVIESLSTDKTNRIRRIRNRLLPFLTKKAVDKAKTKTTNGVENNSSSKSKSNISSSSSSSSSSNGNNTAMPTTTFEKRELFGKAVRVEIPSEDFPTQEQIDSIDETTGQNCRHGWYTSASDCHEIVDGENDGDAAMVVTTKANLHYRYWLPSSRSNSSSSNSNSNSNDDPEGIVIFTHGIMSHSGHASNNNNRPLDVALMVKTFTAKGFAVYARDQYGHGFSEGDRFFIPSWQESRDDLIEFVKLVASKHSKDVPLFVSGESFGGTLTVLADRYFQDHPEEAPPNLDASLLVCPAIIGDVPGFPVYQLLRYVLAPMAPRWTPFFMPNTVSPDRIWKDSAVVECYSDPQRVKMGLDSIGNPFRLGTAVNLLQAMEEAREKAIPGYVRPFCIVHGDEDVAVPMAGSEILFQKSSTTDEDKELNVIESAFHGILADPKAEEAVEIMVKFVDTRMGKFGGGGAAAAAAAKK